LKIVRPDLASGVVALIDNLIDSVKYMADLSKSHYRLYWGIEGNYNHLIAAILTVLMAWLCRNPSVTNSQHRTSDF